MKKKIKAFLISHGHMDIEWYQPMHSYRFWLIDAIERQLSLCQGDPDTIPYTVDGQVFPIEEYLQVCPEKRDQIKALVQTGQLNIGPFFTQFDEWIPSGESMIRNCLYGDRLSLSFGQPMKAGYLPDNFGHPIQLPQILRGFNIDSLIFMRGMPYVSEHFPDEFIYQGIDGSTLTTVTFRSSYSHIFTKGKEQFYLQKRDMPYYNGYLSFESYMDLVTIDDPLDYANSMIDFVNKSAQDFQSGNVPVFVGCDHAPPHVNLAQAMKIANDIQDDIIFQSGSPADYVRAVQTDNSAKPILKEELIGTRYQYILLGALSTRSYLKRDNFAAEAIIEKYAEPLEAIASIYGGHRDSLAQLDEAWRLLMTNHAHDSIHGSSTDEVHTEMSARNNIIRQIGAGVAHNALADISRQVERWWGDRDTAILTYRAINSKLPQFIDVWLPVSDGAISIVDKDGAACPMQILWRSEPELNDICLPTNKLNPKRGIERVLVEIPDGGQFSTLATQISTQDMINPFKFEENCIENEYVRVCAEDAVLNIFDKKEHVWYYGQNLLVETAESGDYWDTSPTWIPSETVLSNRFEQSVEIIEKGPVRAVMQIKTVMSVPANISRGRRSKERVDMKVSYLVTLYRKTRRVEVVLSINNTARDHKISLLVEPRLIAPVVYSQNAFAVLQRPVHAKTMAGSCVQPPTHIYPFREWLAIEDEKRGLAVACRGIYDYEPHIDEITGQTSVSLTLIRGVGNMNRLNTKMREGGAAWNYAFDGGQCLGDQQIEYAFVPYSVADEMAYLDEVNGFLYPAMGHVIRSESIDVNMNSLQDIYSWDKKNIVFSAFKRTYDSSSYILRLFENIGVRTEISLSLKGFGEVYLSDLNESVGEKLVQTNGVVKLLFEPYKIVTVLLKRSPS